MIWDKWKPAWGIQMSPMRSERSGGREAGQLSFLWEEDFSHHTLQLFRIWRKESERKQTRFQHRWHEESWRTCDLFVSHVSCVFLFLFMFRVDDPAGLYPAFPAPVFALWAAQSSSTFGVSPRASSGQWCTRTLLLYPELLTKSWSRSSFPGKKLWVLKNCKFNSQI